MVRALCLFGLSLCTLPLPAQQAAPSPIRPAITGVAFFRGYTTHPAEAERFYGSTLGLAEKTSADAPDTWIFPVNPSQWVEVLHGEAPPRPNVRLAAVGFTTRDVAGLERYLNAGGVPTAVPLHNGEFGVRDPEGNLVFFVQSPFSPAAGAAKIAGPAGLASTAGPLPSASSVRIIHVGFLVHDREKENTFWRGTLGFRPYWYGSHADGSPVDYVSLQVPDGTDWVEYMLNQPADPDLHTAGVMDHFSLGTERMQTVLADLQRNGCTGRDCTAINAGRDGKIQLNLYDPDLTRVEYMEFTPAMKPCCSPFTGTQPGLTENR